MQKESSMALERILSGTPLARHQPQRIDTPRGVVVLCLHGTLWLTQDGEPRDMVLGPGEQHRLEHDTVTYVSALEDARYLLLREPVAAAPGADGWIHAWHAKGRLGELRRWWADAAARGFGFRSGPNAWHRS
jgi:Protein of unknown function (DUF2917)